jgi:hypothetical protein
VSGVDPDDAVGALRFGKLLVAWRVARGALRERRVAGGRPVDVERVEGTSLPASAMRRSSSAGHRLRPPTGVGAAHASDARVDMVTREKCLAVLFACVTSAARL